MTSLDDLRHPDKGPSVLAIFIYLMIGLGIWGLHLTLIYGAHTLICALTGSAGWSVAVIIGATVLAAGPLLFILFGQHRFARLLGIGDAVFDRRTYDAISRFVSILSLAGILWAGVTAAFVSSCMQGR